MSSRYLVPRGSRHVLERVNGVEQLRTPNRRNWFVVAFLPFWLAGWTAGGVAAIRQVAEQFDWFLVFWLGAWAAGWIFAATTLAAQLGGSEIIRVVGQDLEVSNGIGPLRRTWRYHGGSIRNLTPWTPDGLFNRMWASRGLDLPFFVRPKSGAVRFDYGAETLFLATFVDEPEGRTITDWLSRRLPRTATEN